MNVKPKNHSRTTEPPAFYVDQVRQDLGPLWEWLPAGALDLDSHAYRKSDEGQPPAARQDAPAAN